MALLEGSLKVTGFIEAAEFRGLREESVLTGDGAARRFRVRHGLGSRFVRLALYDGAGRRVYAPYRAADSGYCAGSDASSTALRTA